MNNEMQPKSGYVSSKDYKKEKKSNTVNMAFVIEILNRALLILAGQKHVPFNPPTPYS
jgi:hypothetical protein